ncbi:MAG: V-type ATPase subunit, partial [Candidatus Thorarchaeota archaeon]
MMSVARYSFINAKIRGFKADMLTQDHWDGLLGARDMYAALRVLDATSYSEIIKDFDETASPREVEQALRADFNRVLWEIHADVPKPAQPLMNWITRKFQREIVKPLLRLYVTEKDHSLVERLLVPIAPFSLEILQGLINSKDLNDLVSKIPDRYFKDLIQNLLPSFEETGRLVTIEQTIDADVLQNLYKESQKQDGLDKESSTKLAGVEID